MIDRMDTGNAGSAAGNNEEHDGYELTVWMVAIIVWLDEALLIFRLWRGHGAGSVDQCVLPVFHLVPWLLGMISVRKIRRAYAEGRINWAAVSLSCNPILMILLVAYGMLLRS